MSTGRSPPTPRAAKIGIGHRRRSPSLIVAITGGLIAAVVVAPRAARRRRSSPSWAARREILWLLHPDQAYHHLRFIAPTVLDERFADSPDPRHHPALHLRRLRAGRGEDARPPRRAPRAASSAGCRAASPSSCVIASAVFTVLTGGSGVTIIAIGGLLYPALRKQKLLRQLRARPGDDGRLGRACSCPSLPLARLRARRARRLQRGLQGGARARAAWSSCCSASTRAWVGTKENVDREPPELSRDGARRCGTLKWELLIPVILLGVGLGTGLTSIDEAAGLVAFYTVIIEFFVYRDLSWKKDLARIAKASMSLAGAIILILAMANALMNYVVDQHVPTQVLDVHAGVGIKHMWQFLLVMNVFLLVLGMLMEGFSAILVAVPLILPFVANIGDRAPRTRRCRRSSWR